jgi:hypothetical protein
MATYVKVAGTWREATSDSPSNGVCGYVKVNGTWRTVNQSYVKINGAWRSTCTAPGQQPAPVPQTLCLRPNYCNNGTNGIILPTTEPCYLADGVTLGSRTAAYTCQTDAGCTTFTVPAGTCTAPDPIIQVVSEEIGDCEFWGGLSGCTSGYAKRVTKRYSDSSVKVSYSCCNPLLPNLKYYCTLRPFTTGTCLNELKDTDFTGTVVTGQGEWVCEELGIISYPSCSTTENCSAPKTSTTTYEACGYLGTGQRSVTLNTYQSWCETTQATVIGDCLGADDPCGGKYCGEGSGEEEFPTSSCGSGTGVRYKCVTPEGCNVIYNFRRCIAPPPPPPTPDAVVNRYTEICYTTNLTSSPPTSCRQFISYTGPGTPGPNNCVIYGTSGDAFIPCPAIAGPNTGDPGVVNNCPVLQTSQEPCTTDDGRIGSFTLQQTPDGCDDIYGPCVAVGGVNPCSTILETYSSPCDCPDGINTGTQTIQETPGDCPNIEGACTGCPGTVPDTTPTCNGTCVYGSGNQPCGVNGTQSYCITAVGCPDIYGFCNEPAEPETPVEPPVEPPVDPEIPVFPPDFCIFCTGEGLPGGGKSININTLVRTKDGLVAAHDLKVGDKILSADVESFPYDNLAATDIELIDWNSENPYVNLVETEIVNLRYRTAKWAVIVDADIFSDTHYIMVKRGDVVSFVKALDLEHTDLIWSYVDRNWISISVLEKVDVNHEVVSIDCEPYDIFFTERMLTHDSNTVD